MKRKITVLTALLLAVVLTAAITSTALASDGSMTITIHPIRILVNGEAFRPTDVNGNEVMVFTVNGTTYAPLRALAEAYGLEVGYDAANNIATVNSPDRAPSASVPETRDFAAYWTVEEKPVTNYGDEKIFTATFTGDLGMEEFKSWWKSLPAEEIARGAEQLAAEARALAPGYTVTMNFSYGSYMLGTAWGFEGFQQSNFRPASAWIG